MKAISYVSQELDILGASTLTRLQHVLSLPSFQSIRVYHAHGASVTSVSVSPFPPPLPATRQGPNSRIVSDQQASPSRSHTNTSSPNSRQQAPVPNIPSNSIHIATSSVDGNVCVYSLVDPDDVILRKFGRPVQSVALSPTYKQDRSYVSGGLAGSLILTVGGKAGKSATSNTSGAAAATAGWLGAIGIGGQNGTDTVLHSGEGSISTIKWSLGGKYLAWVNEYGIKIMRTNLHLENGESDFAWAKPSHIDRPKRSSWQDMAGVWRARAEWIDEDGLEADDEEDEISPSASKQNDEKADTQSIRSNVSSQMHRVNRRREKLIVGWGDTIWVILVHPGARSAGREGTVRKMGKVEVVTMQAKHPHATKASTDARILVYERMTVLSLEFRYIPRICFSYLHILIPVMIMLKMLQRHRALQDVASIEGTMP